MKKKIWAKLEKRKKEKKKERINLKPNYSKIDWRETKIDLVDQSKPNWTELKLFNF